MYKWNIKSLSPDEEFSSIHRSGFFLLGERTRIPRFFSQFLELTVRFSFLMQMQRIRRLWSQGNVKQFSIMKRKDLDLRWNKQRTLSLQKQKERASNFNFTLLLLILPARPSNLKVFCYYFVGFLFFSRLFLSLCWMFVVELFLVIQYFVFEKNTIHFLENRISVSPIQ